MEKSIALQNKPHISSSYQLSHKYLNDIALDNKSNAKFQETKPFQGKHSFKDSTESKANYVWKYGDPISQMRNPALKKTDFMKNFFDCNLKFLSRPMLPASSVSHSDYLWKTQPTSESVTQIILPTAVAATKINIDPSKAGYSKYLDPSATTSRLDYCHRSPTDIMNGIGAHDNITFWNWKDNRPKKVYREKDSQQCDKLPSSECTKRRGEYQCSVKAVPNSGLTTETSSNYTKPMINIDANTLRQPTFVGLEEEAKANVHHPYQTEYSSIIGLQEKTQKYV